MPKYEKDYKEYKIGKISVKQYFDYGAMCFAVEYKNLIKNIGKNHTDSVDKAAKLLIECIIRQLQGLDYSDPEEMEHDAHEYFYASAVPVDPDSNVKLTEKQENDFNTAFNRAVAEYDQLKSHETYLHEQTKRKTTYHEAETLLEPFRGQVLEGAVYEKLLDLLGRNFRVKPTHGR